MTSAKLPCRQCSTMVLPATAERTGGLCMPCWEESKERWAAQYATDESYDVPLRQVKVPERVYFLFQSCESYCVIDCCGFRACELSRETLKAHLETLSPAESAELRAQFQGMLEEVDAYSAPFKILGDAFTVERFYEMLRPVTDVMRETQ